MTPLGNLQLGSVGPCHSACLKKKRFAWKIKIGKAEKPARQRLTPVPTQERWCWGVQLRIHHGKTRWDVPAPTPPWRCCFKRASYREVRGGWPKCDLGTPLPTPWTGAAPRGNPTVDHHKQGTRPGCICSWGQDRVQHPGAAWRDKFLIVSCSSIKNRNAQLRDDPALQSCLPCSVRNTDVAVFNMKIISVSQGLWVLHPEIQGNRQIHFQGNSPRKTSLPDICFCGINSFYSAAL